VPPMAGLTPLIPPGRDVAARRADFSKGKSGLKKEEAMAAKVNKEKCNGCGECVDICGFDAIKIVDGKAEINDDCVECGACVFRCPNKAITV